MGFLQKFKYLFLVLCLIGIVGIYIASTKKPNDSSIVQVHTPVEQHASDIQQSSVRKNCPPGFILVPGDSLYKTKDFCVMKYDAKCTSVSDPTKGIEPSSGSQCAGGSTKQPNGTYRNDTSGCACTGDKQIVSTASGFPITYIAESDTTPNNAILYCQKNGWHLLTNNEWMTIARNIEKVPDNWCNQDGTQCSFPPGTTGKILANGHNDNANERVFGSGHGALPAGKDTEPCFGTTTDGSNKCGGKSSQKRTLALSNGEILWDLAGNVWQWIDISVLRKDQPQSQTSGKVDLGWIWSEFTPGGLRTVITDNGKGPELGYDAFRPSNPNWNSTNGVGRIYHYGGVGDTNSTAYTFIRGGNWRHGYDSGAFTVHMSPTANKEHIDDVGFRCAATYLLL